MSDSVLMLFDLAGTPEFCGELPLASRQRETAEACPSERSSLALRSDEDAARSAISPSESTLWGLLGNWDF